MKKAFTFAILLVTATASQAQVFKCPGENGKVIYTDAPCNGGKMIDRQRSEYEIQQERRNAVQAQQRDYQQNQNLNQLRQSQLPPSRPHSYSGNSTAGCPSERDIRNIETSASSITNSKFQNQMYARQLAAARACKSGVGQENRAIEPEVEPEHRRIARENPPPDPVEPAKFTSDRINNCTSMGFGNSRCRGDSGESYDLRTTGRITRSDGKDCKKRQNKIDCQ